MRRAAFVLAAALALAACTPMQWVKPEGTAEQLKADLNECQQEAWREARIRFGHYYPMAPALIQDSLGRRLLVYPSGPFADPYGEQFMEEGRLTLFCMRAKGWDLQPAPKK